MKTLIRTFCAVLAVQLVLHCPTVAQEANSANTLRLAEGEESPQAAIDDFSWLSGYWKGEGLGGVSEELWGRPHADRMYGTYALFKEGEAVFSEAMLMTEHAGTVELRIKHFSGDFVAWEEKEDYVTFSLVRLGDNEAYFSGLTFRRTDDALSIFLVLSQEGERTEHEFQLRRVPL